MNPAPSGRWMRLKRAHFLFFLDLNRKFLIFIRSVLITYYDKFWLHEGLCRLLASVGCFIPAGLGAGKQNPGAATEPSCDPR